MFKIVIIILIIVIIYKLKDYKFDIKSFFKKGLPPLDDRFAVWVFHGRQGTGKNYVAIYELLKQSPDVVKKVKTNIKSLRVPGYKIEYFDKVHEIYRDTEEYVIYIIDEVSRKYDKNSRTDMQFYAWLNQSRKRHRIVMLVTQEWKELPMWLRRPVKFTFSTQPFGPKFLHLFCTSLGDAENMFLDKDTLEWECPIIHKFVYKRNMFIANMYDTFEAINDL